MLTYDTLMDICSALPDEIKTALEPTFHNIEFDESEPHTRLFIRE